MRANSRFLPGLTLVVLSLGGVPAGPALADAVPGSLHHSTLQPAGAAGGFRAEGDSYRFETSRMSARVGAGGFSASVPDAETFALSMRLGGVGRGRQTAAVRAAGLDAEADRVVLRYEGLTEWYRSTPVGVEQGFTLDEPPAGSGPVALRLELAAAACGALSGDGRNLRFDLGDGRALHYDGLAAFDATGRELEARLACADGEVLISVDDSGAVYPLTIDPLIFLETKLTAYDGEAGDQFGLRVALSGDTAIVGAFMDDVDTNAQQGSAYVYVRTGGIWSLQARLTAADGEAEDQFGSSLAIDGDTALIGSRDDDIGTNLNQGSAYVFVRSGGVWTQQAKLTDADGEAGDAFGASVAISGETALVGARYDDVGANADQGSAYVFVRSGGVWTPQAQLTSSDGEADDALGFSVAISGDTALIGARNDDVGASPNLDQGSAYVFVRSGGIWTQQVQLTSSDGEAGDFFGISVALSGETALVGAMSDDIDTGGELVTDHGSAYVFVRSAGVWTQEAQLIPADGEMYGNFGSSLSLTGDSAVIGAPFNDADGAIDQGATYLFTRSGTEWTLAGRLTTWSAAGYDHFGRSVGVSGGTVLVGADGTEVGSAPQQGSAHLFDLRRDLAAAAAASAAAPPPGATVYLTASITNYGSSAGDVLVNVLLPAGLTHIASSVSNGTYTVAEGTWSVGPLPSNATATVSILASVNANAAGKNLVFTVSHAGADDDPANNSAAVTLTIPHYTLSLTSNGALDGWILESSENSSQGGSVNAGSTTLLLGDDAVNRQYRTVLSFDTSPLPDNAIIAAATVRLKYAGVTGTSPFATHGSLVADLAKGGFSGNPALQAADFQAKATRAAAATVGKTPVGGWYSGALAAAALPLVNRTGHTQLRLGFAKDDNNDLGADLIKFLSGNAPMGSQPVLLLKYGLP